MLKEMFKSGGFSEVIYKVEGVWNYGKGEEGKKWVDVYDVLGNEFLNELFENENLIVVFLGSYEGYIFIYVCGDLDKEGVNCDDVNRFLGCCIEYFEKF